jgi:CRP-like cAMP-binding protein/predicted GNAT family N-acyltransferase
MEKYMEILFASSEQDKQNVYKQRYQVYVEEMNLYNEIANHRNKILVDEEDKSGHLLYAKKDKNIFASLRMHFGSDGPIPKTIQKDLQLEHFFPYVDASRVVIISRFTVNKKYRGSSVSFLLMARSFKLGCENGAELAFLDCLPHLIPLYERLGFRRYGNEFVDNGVGILSPMCLVGKDTRHLKFIRSPFYKTAKRFFTDNFAPEWVTTSNIFEKRFPNFDEIVKNWSQAYDNYFELLNSRKKIFSGLPDNTIEILINAGKIVSCKSGSFFIKSGTTYNNFYIILEGSCEIRSEGKILGTANAGDIIGEMAFLLDTERTADVIASSEDLIILSLSNKDLELFCKSYPSEANTFLLNLSRILAFRLISLRKLISSDSTNSY